MKKFISFLSVFLVSTFLVSGLFVYADFADEEDLHPLLRYETEDYAKFCTDDNTYRVINFFSGEKLTYDRHTDARAIQKVYTDGLQNTVYKTTPCVITSNSEEFKEIDNKFRELLSNETKNISATTNKHHRPYSGVCLIKANYDESVYKHPGYGTGFIIGETFVATVAHNIFNEYSPVKSMEVYAAFETARGEFAYRVYPVVTFEGKSSDVPVPVEDDYGLLSVLFPMTVHGYYKLNNGEDISVNTRFYTMGFIGEKIHNRLEKGESFSDIYETSELEVQSGSIVKCSTNTLTSSSSVVGTHGLSGSPWFIVKGGDIEVVAILSRDIYGQLTGTRINSTVYKWFDIRVGFRNNKETDYIKNISINHPYYFSGEEIEITVWEVPSQSAWVGLYPQSVTGSSYPDHATGMWCYLETGTMAEPNSFNNKYNRTVTLTAHIRNVHTMRLSCLPNGYYKIVLFRDSGYSELAAQDFIIGGTQLKNVSYNNGTVTFQYKGTTSNGWVGIYRKNDNAGSTVPSIAWKNVRNSMNEFFTENISVKLPAGEYKAILWGDSGYVALDMVEFSVP